MTRQHQISKADLKTTRWVDAPTAALADGEARLKIDAFALTANNVTYAAFGEEPMHYWAFFPAADPNWGRVPVWGFATISESKAEGLEVGRRVYGYFPISDELVVTAAKATDAGFMDGAAHRAGLAPIYSTYSYTDVDPAYVAAYEAEQMLFRPLYATGWWLADTLTDASDTDLMAVVASSASSKTALAMAHALKSHGGAEVIGLTSAANADFVRETGLYDTTITYDALGDLASTRSPAAYVDFRGSSGLNADVHDTMGDALVRSLIVGATDWSGDKSPRQLSGVMPEFFFVPDVASARVKAVGPGIMERMTTDLHGFYPASASLCTPTHGAGEAAIDEAWAKALAGTVPANAGQILTLG